MNYLFFDIECAANINNVSQICSFGYFLCNENYEMLEKKDILIDPECTFDTEHLRKNGVIFAYPEEQFKAAPNFAKSYSEIRTLLTLPETVKVGHATACDALYMIQNIRRYGLEAFDFTFLDTQKLHSFIGGERSISLPSLCELYGVPILHEHKSDDDAEMTAYCAKRICEKCEFSLEAAAKMPQLLGMVHNGELHSSLGSAFPIGDGFNMTPHTKKVFRRYLESKLATPQKSNELHGRCYTFNEEFEHKSFRTALWLVNELRLRGASYTSNALDCDIFVDFPSAAQRNGRRMIVKSLHRKIITSELFLKKLKLTLPPPDTIDTDAILGSTKNGIRWYTFYNEFIKNIK